MVITKSSSSGYMIRYNLLILFAGLCLFSHAVLAATIAVHADRNPVGLNESFRLVYESKDSVDDDPDFSPLQPYLDILNQSQSSNVSIINGSYSSSKSWTLTVMAKQTGEMTLPPISFGRDQSEAYTLTVTETAKGSADKSGFFVRVRAEKTQVYVQQQVVVTQQLFSASNLTAYGLGELSFQGPDVVIEPLGDEKQYQTTIDNRAYLVIERRYAVFPQQSGQLKLSPVIAEARIDNGPRSLFDAFGSRGKVLRARSNAQQIDVLALPVAANMNPWLPAASLEVVEQWPQNPPVLVQGEPMTRTLSIKAEGLTAAQLPVLPDIQIDGLKQYPDQPLLNDIRNDSGVTGYRVEKVALIPLQPGQIQLPAIDIPWWNTQTQTREVARIPARTIQVQAAAVTTDSPPVSPQPLIPPVAPAASVGTSQVPAQNATVESHDERFSPWLWLSLVLGFGWLLTAVLWYRSARLSSLPVVEKVSASTDSAEHLIRQLEKACQAQDASACRRQLLDWGRALYAGQGVETLADLCRYLPAELVSEVHKLDAQLYAETPQPVDFSAIIRSAHDCMKNNQPARSTKELLEPLYR